MKKIISFMLALVMIASMAVVAFADDAAATTPTTETIYDAADFAANDKVVATPDAAKGYTGFSELSLKFDVFQNYQNFFQLENLKKDNTVFLFYYIAQGSGELFFWYEDQFTAIPATEGYHVAQVTLAKDTTHFGFHMKNGDTMELYVGSIIVRQGTINFPSLQLEELNSPKYTGIVGKKFTFNAADYQGYGAYGTNGPSAVVEAATVDGLVDAMGANAGTNVAKLSSSGSTILALNSVSTFQFNKGYTYKITTHAYVVTPSTGNNSYIFNRLTTDWGTAPTFTTGYNKLEFVYTPSNMTDGFGFHGLNGEMYVGNVEIEVLSYNPYGFVTFDANSEYTLVPEQIVLGSQGVVTDEGLLFNDLSLGGWYGPALTSSLNHLWGNQMPLKVEFNVKTLDDGNLMWRNAHNGATVLIAATGDLGDHVWEDVTDPQLLTQIHWQYANPNNPTAALYIKSITINDGKSANHPIVTEWNPADALATKNAVHETIEVEYDFDAEKVYMVSADYRLYAGAKNATITIGEKTMTLKAGDNTVNIAVIGGADKIVINAPEATVLVGDITCEEVGEEYADFMEEVNTYAATLKMDKTLATTVEAAAEYVTDLLEASGKYTVTGIDYVTDSFAPYADDATVAAASAATNGSISFVVDLEETDARGFTYTDEFTFEIVKKDVISDYNAVVATGDSAIVAIVALIAVISLAGVVIAKKKVASK